jgi:prolyl-tRNA editing enzyme YbaK/EbsC (Cys-tRNA(Pro) deacylase)
MMPISMMVAAMSDKLPKSAQKVADRAAALGLNVRIVAMPASTRSAEEAAAACGCQIGRIVKSLVFRGRTSCRPLLILVSGDNRVDVKLVADVIGEAIERPDAAWVRAETGYAIGGIPPFGHDRPLATFMDRDLIAHATVWAAAGTPDSVMEVDVDQLASATGARIIDVC